MAAGPLTAATVQPAKRVRGRLAVPGDKSISHRYAILAALAEGRSSIDGFAPGADCLATLSCLRGLGVAAIIRSHPSHHGGPSLSVDIAGRGLRGLTPPSGHLDAQNSGTTMRLLAGVLAAHKFSATLTGDDSLRRRPMRRVIDPLERMGALIHANDDRPPLRIEGADLRGIRYALPVASAQVQSAVLLAGLQADGSTTVVEAVPTRNHTELAMAAFGADIERSAGAVRVDGGRPLQGHALTVPGDCSSAAALAVAAAALPGSDVELLNVGLNPTRTAWLKALEQIGASVDVDEEQTIEGEPRGRVRIRHGALRPLAVGSADVASLIDELPVLAALAAHGGELTVRGAAELRLKESDRISALVRGFRALGVEADETDDGFHVRGARPARGGVVDAAGDHRLAMAFALVALGATGPTAIVGADCVAISFPGFFDLLDSMAA